MNWLRVVFRILSCISLVATTSVWAGPNEGGLDSHVTLLARTYAPGLSINPSVGFSQKIWGDTATPLFGFFRPYVIGVVSPSVYEGKVGIELFPISFLGVDVRRAWGRRFVDTRGQDCDQVECQGELGYTDLSFKMFLGYRKTFASLRWTQTFFDSIENRARRIYELGSSVLINPDGDRGDYLNLAVGENLNGLLDGMSVGVLLQSNQFRGTGHRSDAAYLFSRLEMPFEDHDDSSVTVGLGAFRSNLNVPELSIVTSIVYQPRPALGYGR